MYFFPCYQFFIPFVSHSHLIIEAHGKEWVFLGESSGKRAASILSSLDAQAAHQNSAAWDVAKPVWVLRIAERSSWTCSLFAGSAHASQSAVWGAVQPQPYDRQADLLRDLDTDFRGQGNNLQLCPFPSVSPCRAPTVCLALGWIPWWCMRAGQGQLP